MAREIYIQHPDVNNGTETQLEHVKMSPIRELPPSPGGVTSMANIVMTGPMGSPDYSVLNAVRKSKGERMLRLRTENHEGNWLIERFSTPGFPSDDRFRVTLCFAG